MGQVTPVSLWWFPRFGRCYNHFEPMTFGQGPEIAFGHLRGSETDSHLPFIEHFDRHLYFMRLGIVINRKVVTSGDHSHLKPQLVVILWRAVQSSLI